MKTEAKGSRFLTVMGWTAIILFAAIYVIELFPHHGPPVTIIWIRESLGTGGLIILNIVIVLAFLALLPFRRPTKNVWKSHSAFFAFVIALMTEMFGWPLFIFLVSPFFEVPTLARGFFGTVGHWPASVGTAISLFGIVLIAIGWKQIHAAQGLVSSGLYRYIRHPQYSGIFLFTLGWIMHWPTVLTLLLWPILIAAYVWLARFEEKQALEEFGESYQAYARETKRFIPFLV
ncbi:MAG: methyltransferase family protein [Candidatus Glassbacteria bacterium]